MTKLLKNNKGFTLVEVIVVAVIVLILAAVAIPLYNGYINDSRYAMAEGSAGSIAGALTVAMQLEVDPTFAAGPDNNTTVTIPSARAGGDDTVIQTPKDFTVSNADPVTDGYVVVDGPNNVSACKEFVQGATCP